MVAMRWSRPTLKAPLNSAAGAEFGVGAAEGHDGGGLGDGHVGEHAEGSQDEPGQDDALQGEVAVALLQVDGEVAGASVELGGVDGDGAGHAGEQQAGGDAEDGRGALGRHPVGQPDGDEHDGQRTNDGDQQRRRPGQHGGHEELDDQQQARGEADERQHAAPARKDDDQGGEEDDQPAQGAAAIQAGELIGLGVVRARRCGHRLQSHVVARGVARDEVRRAEIQRRDAAALGAVLQAGAQLPAALGDRSRAAHVAHCGHDRPKRLAAKRLRRTVMGRRGPQRDQTDQRRQRQRRDAADEHAAPVRAGQPSSGAVLRGRAIGAGVACPAGAAALGALARGAVDPLVPLVGIEQVQRAAIARRLGHA